MNELRELCKIYQPALIFLMETKAPRERISKLQRSLRFHSSFCVESRGLSGGLCLLWTDQISVQILHEAQNYIHTALCFKQGGGAFDCSFVYGHPNYQLRRGLWSTLVSFQMNRDFPWCCMGDFNEMLIHTDKCGLRPINQNRAALFRDFINITGLMELDLKGCIFTWASNPRNGVIVREKLDRALANWAWRSIFPHAMVTALPMVSSDHSPLIFQATPAKRSGKSFKYEAFWEEHSECGQVVKDGWLKSTVPNDPWKNLTGKIKDCKRTLQQWQNLTFRRADEQIKELKEELKRRQDLVNHWQMDEESKRIQDEIKSLWRQEELYWCQRSRVKWLKDGDRNSSFFHATTVQRRGRNRIERLKNSNGEWVEGQCEIFQLITSHFQEVYTSDNPPCDEECLSGVNGKVTQQMNGVLNNPVSDQEIKKAVDSMGALRAPGPDGFNGLFFQKN